MDNSNTNNESCSCILLKKLKKDDGNDEKLFKRANPLIFLPILFRALKYGFS